MKPGYIINEPTHLASVHTTPEEFENAALFLRLGLPSTLIRHENGAFRKRSSNRRNLKAPALVFVWKVNILKMKLFEDEDNHVTSKFLFISFVFQF